MLASFSLHGLRSAVYSTYDHGTCQWIMQKSLGSSRRLIIGRAERKVVQSLFMFDFRGSVSFEVACLIRLEGEVNFSATGCGNDAYIKYLDPKQVHQSRKNTPLRSKSAGSSHHWSIHHPLISRAQRSIN